MHAFQDTLNLGSLHCTCLGLKVDTALSTTWLGQTFGLAVNTPVGIATSWVPGFKTQFCYKCQLPADVQSVVTSGGPNDWFPVLYMGDMDSVPGCWFSPWPHPHLWKYLWVEASACLWVCYLLQYRGSNFKKSSWSNGGSTQSTLVSDEFWWFKNHFSYGGCV